MNKSLNQPMQTEIKRSPIYGIEPVTRYPARLRSFVNKQGNLIDVMRNAREPYGSNMTVVDQQFFQRVINDTLARIMSDSSTPVKRELLTLE